MNESRLKRLELKLTPKKDLRVIVFDTDDGVSYTKADDPKKYTKSDLSKLEDQGHQIIIFSWE